MHFLTTSTSKNLFFFVACLSLASTSGLAEPRVIALSPQGQQFAGQVESWDCGANSAAAFFAASGVAVNYSDFKAGAPRLKISLPLLLQASIRKMLLPTLSNLKLSFDPTQPMWVGAPPSVLAVYMNEQALKQGLALSFETADHQTLDDLIRLVDDGKPPHAVIQVDELAGFPLIHTVWILGYDSETGQIAYRDPSKKKAHELVWESYESFLKKWHFQGGFSYDLQSDHLLLHSVDEDGTSRIPRTGAQFKLADLSFDTLLSKVTRSLVKKGMHKEAELLEASGSLIPLFLPMLGVSVIEVQIDNSLNRSWFEKDFSVQGGTLIIQNEPSFQLQEGPKQEL